MAIFPHFLTSLVTFLVVRTTFMHLSSAERTQTLLTHVGWRYGAIFALSGHLYGAGRVQSRAILESKSDYYGRLVTGWGLLLETVLWAISHLITWHNMTLGHFCPLQAPLWRRKGPKYGYFGGKIQLLWQACSRVGYSIWKVSSAPYHILRHGKTLLKASNALSGHPYGAGRVQNMAIFGSKSYY